MSSPDQASPGRDEVAGAASINNYARKHWGGLVSSYYVARTRKFLELGLASAAAGLPFSMAEMNRKAAQLSYQWQTDFGHVGALEAVGDPVDVSVEVKSTWSVYFSSCE